MSAQKYVSWCNSHVSVYWTANLIIYRQPPFMLVRYVHDCGYVHCTNLEVTQKGHNNVLQAFSVGFNYTQFHRCSWYLRR